MDSRELLKLAEEARLNAYVPYSKFRVGAALLTSDGKVYTGCNIESASFGATNCAERTAIFNGVSRGNKVLKALALIGDTNNYTYPCGICRQVIGEFAEDRDMKIYIVKNENDYIETTLNKIMPEGFFKEDLNK